MLEHASMALIQIRSELQKAGMCVKLQLLLQCESGQQRIDVFLHCDNYSDVLAACAQVPYCCGSGHLGTLSAHSQLDARLVALV